MMEQRNTHSGAKHRIQCLQKGDEWQIWLNSKWWQMEQIFQKAMSDGVEEGIDVVEYVWQYAGHNPECVASK